MKPLISIIVPVFNEENRINNLAQIAKFFDRQKFSTELIVVNDGSTDNTLDLIKSFNFKNKLKIISYLKNRGKGFAIKRGIEAATGKYRLFLDIDLSTPLKETNKFLSEAKKGNDVVIGSRKVKGAKLIKRQPLLRETLGKGFTLLSRLILGVKVSDFTCGFKLFSEEASKKIFRDAKINRWGFDSEILYLASRHNFKIKELPVSWKDNSATKVRFSKDIVNSLWELFLIKVYSVRGTYDSDSLSPKTKQLFISNVVLFLTIIILALMILWPSFSLALFGDDWLAFYRYKFHLGEWSTKQFNHLSYLLTPYGAQDILMGLLQKVFGYASFAYYVTSFTFRLLVTLSIYLFVKFFTGSKIGAWLSAVFFAITPIGLDATNWVFNMPSYIGLIFVLSTLYFFIRAQKEKAFPYLPLAALSYYLAFVVAPIRMHGLPLIIIALDVFLFVQKRNIKILKTILLRQIIMIVTFFLIRASGQSMGLASDTLQKLTSGLDFIFTSTANKEYAFFLNPLVIVGRFFLPETAWPFINNILPQPSYVGILAFSFLIFTPFILIFRLIEKGERPRKRLFTIFLIGLFFWSLIVKLIARSNMQPISDPAIIGPALIGGFFLILGLGLSIKYLKNSTSNFVFVSVAWVFTSFAFPWFWNPFALLGTTHRYLIMPALGMALFWGAIICLARNRAAFILTFITAIVFITIHAQITNNYFVKLVSVRGVKISAAVWNSLPQIETVGKIEGPLVFYFEGNRAILNPVVTFGFPPHMALVYNISEGNKIPLPLDNWDDVVVAVTTGENMPAYGYRAEPVPIDKIYSFRLQADGSLKDITTKKRLELLKI